MATERREIDPAVAKLEVGYDELGRRIGGLEKGFSVLQSDVHSGFSDIKSAINAINSRPTFNFHETVRTVLSLAMLLSATVGAVIWIVNGQFSGVIAEQKALNGSVIEKLKEDRAAIESLRDRTQWLPSAPSIAKR